jgi:hypothetical protein
VIERMFWRLTKKEITEWIERKEREFDRKENRNPWMKNEQWMQRYVYIVLHEIFYGEFPIILAEWLERLVDSTRRYQTTTSRNWNPELVR